MINLLPPDLKQEYRYARRNRHLLQWVGSFLVVIVGLAIITGTGLVYLNNSANTYRQRTTDTNQQLQAQNLAGVQKQVTAMSNNLKLAVQVLSKEVLFSKLLTQLGSITPPNVVLTGLAISQTQGAIDITAQTTDYNAAAQLQANLADPANQIFAKADLVSINCTPTGSATGVNAAYPCAVSLRALFASNNSFLFIGNSSKGAAS
jgi:Tfp pilus assembly protein PilN